MPLTAEAPGVAPSAPAPAAPALAPSASFGLDLADEAEGVVDTNLRLAMGEGS